MTEGEASFSGGRLHSEYLNWITEANFEGLNRFYKRVESEIKRSLKEGRVKEIDDLLRIRLYAPLVSLYLIRKTGLPVDCNELPNRERLTKIRSVALYSILERLGFSAGEIPFSVRDKELLISAKNFLIALKKGSNRELEEPIARLQIFEVGSKQALVSRTGGFADMRGASAMIDIAPRLAADGVSNILGSEFLLTCEAGELVFLSPPEFAEKLEESILMDYVLNEELCPYLNILLLRGNGVSRIDVCARNLLEEFGQVFMSSLLTLRELNLSKGEEYLEARLLCRNCRNNRGLDGDALISLARKVVSNPSKIKDIHTSVMGGNEVLCRTCYVTRLYAKALIDILSGNEDSYSDRLIKYIKEASAYRILSKAIDEAKRRFCENYVYSIEDYDCDDRLAVFGLVYGDGDRFGTLKKYSRNIFDFYFLSLFFSELMSRGVKEGIAKVLNLDVYLANYMKLGKYPVPITPLFVAGDDFLLGLRGEYAYVFVQGFYEGAKQVYESLKDFLALPFISKCFKELMKSKIGVSMGIAVGKTRVPGVFLYDASYKALRFVKGVTRHTKRKFNFGVHASLIYSKSKVSWDLVNRLVDLPSKDSDIYEKLFNHLIYFDDDGKECPISSALKATLCHGEGRVKSTQLKEVMEEFLAESRHPLMAFIKILNDIARDLERNDEETVKRAENMKKILEAFFRACEVNEYSWRWLYTVLSILNMIENRERCEQRFEYESSEFEYELLKLFVGC